MPPPLARARRSGGPPGRPASSTGLDGRPLRPGGRLPRAQRRGQDDAAQHPPRLLPPAPGRARVFGRDVAKESRRGARAARLHAGERRLRRRGISAVRFVRMMAELSGLPRRRRARAGARGALLRRARRGALPHARDLLARHEAARQARAGDRARAASCSSSTSRPTASTRRRAQRMLRLVARDRARRACASSSRRTCCATSRSCCDQVIVLKEGRIAALADLEEERRSRAPPPRARDARRRATATSPRRLAALGCEVAQSRTAQLKVVLPDAVAVRELYRLAAERGVQLRRLTSSATRSRSSSCARWRRTGDGCGASGGAHAGL